MEFNRLYLGDAVNLLQKLPDESIDLVVTSPPYESLRTYNKTLEGWTEDKWRAIIKNLYPKIKIGGVVVWVVNDKTIDGSKSLVSFKQALWFKECGFCVNDVMIWNKPNYMPQISQPRYSDAFEYMFVFSKGKPKTFNPIKEPTKCSGKTYNSTAKNMDGESGRHELNYIVNSEKTKSNVWNIAVAQNKTSHPAVFPYTIPYNHILSWTNEGDVVLDIFAGSGTTLMAAKELRRKWIGFEISKEYFDLASSRVSSVMVAESLY